MAGILEGLQMIHGGKTNGNEEAFRDQGNGPKAGKEKVSGEESCEEKDRIKRSGTHEGSKKKRCCKTSPEKSGGKEARE